MWSNKKNILPISFLYLTSQLTKRWLDSEKLRELMHPTASVVKNSRPHLQKLTITSLISLSHNCCKGSRKSCFTPTSRESFISDS